MTDASTFGLVAPSGGKAGSSAQTFGLADPSVAVGGSSLDALWEGFKRGARDILEGGAQIGARMGEAPQIGQTAPEMPGGAARVDEAVRQSAAQYGADPSVKAHPVLAGAGRVGGNVAGTLPLSLIPGAGAVAGPASIGGRVAGEAALGALSGMMQPVTQPGQFGKEKAKQAVAGGVAGPLASEGGRVVGSLVAPQMRKAAEMLSSQGVPLTIGQMSGGMLRRAESALRSVPILGSFIKNAEEQSIEGFNKATINQALVPIREKLPADVGAGHDAMKYMHEKIGQVFDRIWPQVSFKPDIQYATGVQKVRQLVGELPADIREQANRFIKNRVIDRYKDGGFTGEALQHINNELGDEARKWSASDNPAYQNLGEVYRELLDEIRDGIERQNPALAPELSEARFAHAMAVRIDRAAGRRAGSASKFSPLDLLSGIRQESGRVRRRDFLQGDALLQGWAEAGQKVIPETVPDSGTTERALWTALITGTAFEPRTAAAIPALVGAGLPYTQTGRRIAQSYMTPGAGRQSIADRVKTTSQYLAAPAGAVAGR